MTVAGESAIFIIGQSADIGHWAVNQTHFGGGSRLGQRCGNRQGQGQEAGCHEGGTFVVHGELLSRIFKSILGVTGFGQNSPIE